jgi:hypothetical protein
MLKQVIKDEDVVVIGDKLLAMTCLYRYLNNMKRVSIDDVNKSHALMLQDAIMLKPTFRKFVRSYELKRNKKYKDFNLFEKDQVKKEFIPVYEQLKKNSI